MLTFTLEKKPNKYSIYSDECTNNTKHTNKGIRKLKHFGHNTSSHQQEMTGIKHKLTTSTLKETTNNKKSFALQNKYYNSPSSHKVSTQHSKSDNTRINSAYRRSNSNNTGKDNQIIPNLKVNSIAHNSKLNSSLKQRNSENFRKIEQRIGNEKNINKSSYKIGGSTVISLKNSQNLFVYPLNKRLMNKQTDEGNFYIGGESHQTIDI